MNSQNESPFGQPKTLVILLFVFLGLWGWQYFIDKKYPKAPMATIQSSDPAAAKSNPKQTEQSAQTATPQTVSQISAKPNSGNAVAVLPVDKKFIFENDKVMFEVSSNGFGFSKYQIKEYKDQSGQFIQYNPTTPMYALIYKNQTVPFVLSKISDFEYSGEAVVEGRKISRKINFNPATLSFSSEIQFDEGFEALTVALDNEKLVPKSSSIFFPSFEHQDYVYIQDAKTKSEAISTLKPGEGLLMAADRVSMASIGTQYFTAAAINKSDIIPSISKKVEGTTAFLYINYDLKNTTIRKINQIYYIGAKKTEVLNSIDSSLAEVMNYGMFGFISKPLLKLLVFMHTLLGNWGLALIAMTVIVRLVLLPFNVISFRSAQAMQRVKPQMDAVREKYKNDPMRMNKETMALMKEQKANPVSGCLPMLLQIPIFFALWKMISTSVEIYQQPFFGWIKDLSTYDHFFVLPILMGITMFLQQKMTPTTLDPMQAKILNFMPIMFTIFMVSLPSGLTLYNFISSLFGVIQQYVLLKDKNKTAVLKPALKT